MEIKLNPGRSLRFFLSVISLLLCANIVVLITKFYFGHDRVFGLSRLFDFNTEQNIPTLYSSVALLLASLLLGFIAWMHKRAHAAYVLWAILAVIFLFLSIDETSAIHENLGTNLRELLNTSGLLYYSWVLPYGAFLGILVIVYAKFLLRLDTHIRVLFLLAGGIFISGSIVIESLGGQEHDLYGKGTLWYAVLYTCEEFLEMLGIVIFIYALLKYILTQLDCVKITITQ